jgi:hypothetical protein
MERLRAAWLELRYRALSNMITGLHRELVRYQDLRQAQYERNQLLSGLISKDEEVRRKASDEINTRILDDMQRHPEKYVP